MKPKTETVRSVAVKHYLRGEEGIHYVDLYHLVKFLPSYALPAGFPQNAVNPNASRTSLSHRYSHTYSEDHHGHHREHSNGNAPLSPVTEGSESSSQTNVSKKDGGVYTSVTAATSASNFPLPPSPGAASVYSGTSVKRPENQASLASVPYPTETIAQRRGVTYGPDAILPAPATAGTKGRTSLFSPRGRASFAGSHPQLLPAKLPPKWTIFDVFPFSLFVKCLTNRGKGVEGKKAARYRARTGIVTHNVPLEISLYLVNICIHRVVTLGT